MSLRVEDFKQVASHYWELPASFRADMQVPAGVFADRVLLERLVQEPWAFEQLINVATLPGTVQHALAMPDVHGGYGFPVGGVAAMRASDGVVSPGGVGYDINCGVRLLAIDHAAEEVESNMESFVHELSRSIPAGPRRGALGLSLEQLDGVLAEGSGYVVQELGLGLDADVEATESEGRLEGADPDEVSERAKQRGHDQLGTMGSGNHFVEVQKLSAIYDETAASVLGLEQGIITVLIHSGSRGLGHQVCTDYVRLMEEVMRRYGITLPDRQLACAPIESPEGRRYLAAMACAANFAWSNRQVITARVRETFGRVFGGNGGAGAIRVIYDVAHNIAKFERHAEVGEVCVHRKGATRAYGPGHEEIPARYRDVGQPVFIPGSMGTGSHVLVGQEGSARWSFGSACHGAGRALSRTAARRQTQGAELRRQLEERGIVVRCPSNKGLAEEAPLAYKDVDMVVDVVHEAGLARKVARLVPVGVVKG